MGNTNQPITRLLFNQVLPKDWGHYVDKNNVKNILIKRDGITIPKGTMTTMKVSDYMPGRLKAMFIEKNKYPVVPGEPYSFGYTFIRTEKAPGVNNNNYFPQQDYYFGKVNGAAALVGGVVADSDVLSIEDQIIALASADSAKVASTCFVNLRRAYNISDTVNTAASGFKVTWEDGSSYVFASAAVFAAGKLGADFNGNANVNTKLVCIRAGADKYIITSIDPYLKFYIGTVTGGAVINNRYVYAESKDVNYKVTAQFDPREAVCTGAYICGLDDTAGSSVANTATTCYVNGTSVAVTGHATIANLVANFNTALNASAAWAISHGNNIWVYAPATLKTFSVKLGDLNKMVKIKESSPEGSFPSLSADDIFRTFIGRGSHGTMYNRRYVTNQPVQGGIYRKYIFNTQYDNESLTQSAGGMLKVNQVVEIFVLLSEAITNKLKNNAGVVMEDTVNAAPDISLGGMFAL